MPEVSIVRFPMIANLLLTALYQAFIDSTARSVIDNGISKKLIPDVIKGVAFALLNTLLMHGLFKGIDQAPILKELEKRLQKLVDELAEILPQTIRQADGTVVLKGYNGMANLRKRQKENRKEREYVKKHLKENPKRFIINNKEYKQIWLPEKEHGAVRSAFTTYIMQNNYTEPTLIRCYGDYVYTAVLEEVDGQLLPVFVKKKKIKGVK